MRSSVDSYLGFVAEPETIDGLSADRPDPNIEFSIVGRYKKTPDGGKLKNPNGPWIWCSHCQRPTHWEGLILESSKGTLHLIGIDCGKLHYGIERFRIAHSIYLAYEEKVNLISDLDKFQNAAGELILEIRNFKHSDAFSCLRESRRKLQTASPDLAMRLNAAKLRGDLSVYERVSTGNGQYDLMPVQLGPLEGSFFVSDSADITMKAAEDAIQKISAIDVSQAETKDLLELKKLLGRSLSDLVKLKQQLETSHAFFSRRNLKRLERWSQPMNRYFRVTAGDRCLEIWDYKKGFTTLPALPKLKAPPLRVASSLIK